MYASNNNDLRQGRLRSLNLVGQPVHKKEKSEFTPVKIRLKTDLVSQPDLAEKLSKYINNFWWYRLKCCSSKESGESHLILHPG